MWSCQLPPYPPSGISFNCLLQYFSLLSSCFRYSLYSNSAERGILVCFIYARTMKFRYNGTKKLILLLKNKNCFIARRWIEDEGEKMMGHKMTDVREMQKVM